MADSRANNARQSKGQAPLPVRLFVVAVTLIMVSCGGGGGGQNVASGNPAPPVTSPSTESLSSTDAAGVVQRAAEAADDGTMVIAVTDRAGRILALYRKPGAPATVTGNFGQTVNANEQAVALARTASFFSNNQAPLSTRTVRFISGKNFPPGVEFTGISGALYGIENTNRGCELSSEYIPGQEVPPARSIDGTTTGLGISTGKADLMDSDPAAVNPGGVPLFRGGVVVGGVGVVASSFAVAEFAAFTAAVSGGFGPVVASPGVVIIDGIALPFVEQTTRPGGFGAGSFNAALFVMGPAASPGAPPEGDLVAPVAGPLGGLTAAEVRLIIDQSIAAAQTTRAVIRLPLGSRARMAIAVADLDGRIIGMHRMADSTVFSIDVAATKARNMIYFSGPTRLAQDLPEVPGGTAVTNRTISFGAQPLYPPGIGGSLPGPFFDLYTFDTLNPCTQGFQPAGPNQSGIVFFPGSLPLYKNGVLVGGLGISGDGVEQDDYVAALGAVGFEAPEAIRADQIFIRDAPLPYLKFPRNPTD